MPLLKLKKAICCSLTAAVIGLNGLGNHSMAADALANLPDLGDAAGADLSVQDEKQLGGLIMKDYRSFGVVNDDPEINAYLNKLGQDIVLAAGRSPIDFEFFLVTNTAINAFALPGGFIGVHTGLISAARTESELASVLAHEVGHVTQRHIARMYGQQKQTSLVATAAMIAAILVASSNPQAAQGIASAGAGYQMEKQLGFSRDAEREADRVGFSTLVNAGFDPNGMVVFFERLQQGSRLYGNEAPEYLRTHPLTTARIADIRNRVGTVSSGRTDDQNLPFELIRIRSAIYSDKTKQQLLDRLTSLKNPSLQVPFTNPIAQAYGRAIIYDKLNERGKAFEEIDQAIKLAKSRLSNNSKGERRNRIPALLESFRVDLLVAQRVALNKGSRAPVRKISELNEADSDLMKQLEMYRREYSDSPKLREQYGQGLLAMGLYSQAQDYLRQLSVVLTSDPAIFDMLAQASFSLGNLGEHHLYLAQHYAARQAYFPAIEQTEIALRYAQDDYYLTSEIQSKQRRYKALADQTRRQAQKFTE